MLQILVPFKQLGSVGFGLTDQVPSRLGIIFRSVWFIHKINFTFHLWGGVTKKKKGKIWGFSQKCSDLNLGILKAQGFSNFLEMCELKLDLRQHPK